jgi:hypothetical protein
VHQDLLDELSRVLRSRSLSAARRVCSISAASWARSRGAATCRMYCVSETAKVLEVLDVQSGIDVDPGVEQLAGVLLA